MSNKREFDFLDRHFELVAKRVKDSAGISLSENKKDLVYGRLARRLRKLNIDNFDAYFNYLDNSSSELVEFTNSITTNLTSFFRENHHFDFLANTAMPYLLQQRRAERRIRIWSAGCSTGEEPYSIAITLLESVPDIVNWDIKILATDIDTQVLDTAKEGIYRQDKATGLDEHRIRKWFLKSGDKQNENLIKAKNELKQLIVFKQLNLMGDWPMQGQFDILFCRNVVIYFDKDTQRVLFERFANILKQDAYMYVGHSESLYQVTERFSLLGKTIHRKAA